MESFFGERKTPRKSKTWQVVGCVITKDLGDVSVAQSRQRVVGNTESAVI